MPRWHFLARLRESSAALTVFRPLTQRANVREAWSPRPDVAWLVGGSACMATVLQGLKRDLSSGAQGRPEDLPRRDLKREDNTWCKRVQLLLLRMASPVLDPEHLPSPGRSLPVASSTSRTAWSRFSLSVWLSGDRENVVRTASWARSLRLDGGRIVGLC